jgi:hypothetical protein
MDIILLQQLATSLSCWHAARVWAMTEANMNLLKRVPSYLAALAAIAVIALPVTGGPRGWHDRMNDPVVFLMALTFAGAALVLWPLGTNNAVQH